ncbi:hypothetical protein M5C99_12250 [Acidovorax sp. NCPPB 2350]|nr:hypothetical protein M5C99_12250 [Acidovorax sp. NCPPB 2350]
MSPIVSGLASVASMLFNASSAAKSSAASAKTDKASTPEPSSIVTLSQDATSLARMADRGMLLASEGGASGRSAGVADAQLSQLSVNRSVSKEDFQAMLTRFGATDAQKDEITKGFDADQDGAISRDEFLKGIARTADAQGGGEFGQALLQLMDRGGKGNADGSVGTQEFAAFSRAYANASKGVRTIG